MSKLNGFILSCALVLVASTATAQVSVSISDAAGSATIPPEHVESVSIDPVTNVISITTNIAYTVQLAEAPCEVDCGDVAPGITLFNVSTPVTVGELTTVNWAATDNATDCTASGDYAGWADLGNTIGTSGTGFPVSMDVVGTFTFSLTCNNGALPSTMLSRTVVVNDVVINQVSVCDDYTSPLSGITLPWNEFYGIAFPNPGYANEYMTITNRYGYTALEFNTGNFVDTGSVMTVESTATSGSRFGSISQCPGDYDVAPECKFVWGTSGGIVWSTENYANACQLDPDTTYYVNITFTDGFDPTESSCNDSKCVTTVRVYNP